LFLFPLTIVPAMIERGGDRSDERWRAALRRRRACDGTNRGRVQWLAEVSREAEIDTVAHE